MRVLLTFLLLLAATAAAGCGTERRETPAPAAISDATGPSDAMPAEIEGEGYSGVRMTPERWAGHPEPEGTLFQASEDEVAAAERALAAGLAASSDPRVAEIVGRLGDYVRQYIGVERDGSRLLYVNAFCDAAGLDPKTQVVAVEDGGTCFWQALIDADGTVLELRINGDA